MTRLEEIIRTTRKTGNTTWILQSAIARPNCIIVSRTMENAERLEEQYNKILNKSVWYKKLLWKWFGRENPKFVSLDYNFKSYHAPVIFDNESLL